MIAQHTIEFETRGRGSYSITDRLQHLVGQTAITTGLCHVFLQHTSASLMLCENADPDVRVDMETFMARLAPDGDPLLVHTAEGRALPREHGGPVRMITPQLWAWKGAKWIARIEVLTEHQRGFWEQRGYSDTAHPWRDDRYAF